jgi:ATP-dependent helicase HrpA
MHRRVKPSEPSPSHALPPAKSDAVHRALLAGLLGNVGLKGEGTHEYSGARGGKFAIFPGSGLFKANPKWIVAAELVETTKLYARTVAKIQPEWLERVAEHLIKKTHTDPRWQPERGHVVATEKVSLYGLVLVPQRTVHYGPINPREAREIFIRAALVEGDWRTDAPFFRHNGRLVKEVQALEAKQRRRDILVDSQAIYDFYDAHIPPGIYNAPLFDKWRREIERHNPKALFMTRRDLMRHGADEVTAEQFPDFLVVNNVPLSLEYDLDPGGAMDGLTLVVPLAMLNQVPAARFEWLVPGLLREKIVELIRSLPKPIRVQFVPVTDTADEAAAKLRPSYASLFDALAEFLGKKSGTPVRRSDFDPQQLPPYLHLNFRVIDEHKRTLATGRDLDAIRRQLGLAARESFAAMPKTTFTRENLTSWDFGDLPPSIEVKRDGLTFLGYPALVDRGESASLELLDSPDAARQAMRAGVRRLFMTQVRDELRYVERNLPGFDAMALNYATLGNSAELKADLLHAIADRALSFAGDTSLIRAQADFIRIAEQGWRNLNAATREVCDVVATTLAAYQSLRVRLSEPFAPMLHPSIRDMQEQLAHLVFKGFAVRIPWGHLQHLPRYLAGIEMRLKKLTNAGLSRDEQNMAIVVPLWKQYLARLEKHRREGVHGDAELITYRWMLEELRVSLFAQELGTATTVSPQRVEKQWDKVEP